MLPIVNGLTQDYTDKIAFIKLNANEAGKAAFAYYRLLGHPSYVILKPDGTKVWSYVGLRTRDEIAQQLDASIATITSK